MKFKKYSSIENTYRQRTINHIIQQGLSDGKWQVTEKIHGCNFSMWRNREEFKFAKRSSFTDGDFYNCQEVVDKYKLNMHRLWQTIRNNGGFEVTVFGELYGPGIQTGVYYSDEKDFAAFDIMVDGELLSPVATYNMCIAHRIPHVPVIGYFEFQEALKHSPEFNSILGNKEDNISEGVVIKPMSPKFFKNGGRVILKNKSKKFSETNGTQKPKKSNNVTLTEDTLKVVEVISTYINENRLRNVISKIGQVSQKEFAKVSGLLTQDAIQDYEKDLGTPLTDLLGDERKTAYKAIGNVSSMLLREHFVNIIDGEF